MDKEEKRSSPLRRVLAFLATAVLILAAVFLVAHWQNLNFDFIRRWWAYRSLSRDETGQAQAFVYEGDSGSSFLQVGDDLLVCSQGGVRMYSAFSGTAYLDQTCSLKNPILSSAGNTALVYEAGGKQLFVFRDRALVYTYETQADRSILSASLNAQGRLTIATQASGVKGAVTVYNDAFQEVISVKISSRFVTDAILSPDGATLALATAGQSDGSYDSQVAFYSLSRSAENSGPDAVYELGGDAILKLSWSEGPLRVLSETALTYVNADGTVQGSYSFGLRHLKGFSLEGENSSALLLGKHRAGTEADLVTVDLTGEETASLPVEQQVLSLSAAGRYLSVLTVDGLTIYSDALEPYHLLDDPTEARQVLQRPDGTVMLISSELARLYLPN